MPHERDKPRVSSPRQKSAAKRTRRLGAKKLANTAKKPTGRSAYPKPRKGDDFSTARPGTKISEDRRGRQVKQRTHASQGRSLDRSQSFKVDPLEPSRGRNVTPLGAWKYGPPTGRRRWPFSHGVRGKPTRDNPWPL